MTPYDAVVVGSGFGGSIAALRLAEAGRSVLVLERGRRWKPEDFPRDPAGDNVFWRERRNGTATPGLYDVRFFSGIAAVAASGVGGGSLIYANIHVRPDPSVFDDPRWPRALTRQSLDPYYDRVAGMLQVAPLPAALELAKRDVFQRAGHALGERVFDPDQAVAWETDPGPGRSSCRHCAECEFGCTYGAKHTLDFNYLPAAELLGAVLETRRRVTHVAPHGEGYEVFYKTCDGAPGSAVGRRVVLAAGTIGSNEILLRSRDESRTLPALSRRLGHGYSGNGDFLGSIQNSRENLEPWNGPDVTTVIDFFDGDSEFTMAAPTFNRATMEVLASLGQPGAWPARLLAPLLWPFMGRLLPWAFRRGMLSRPSRLPARNAGDPARMTNLFAIGRDNANGLIERRRGRVDVRWDYAGENEPLVAEMTAAMRAVAERYGGTFAPLAIWSIFKKIITVHSLGGCHLSESPDSGVVSPDGEAHGYPGLFVADGSVIPTAIGFHPVMTISAVSERIADAVAASY